MTSEYGKGRYCPPAGSPLLKYVKKDAKAEGPACLHLDDLNRVLAKSHDFAELTEAWKGWHEISVPMKDKFVRYVNLANKGAREIGFDDVGALWRAGYDMPPADFEADIERLWRDVKPLYDELHCYVRSQLQAKYGKDKVPDRAPIPGPAARQHVGAGVGQPLRHGRAVPEGAVARRRRQAQGEAHDDPRRW